MFVSVGEREGVRGDCIFQFVNHCLSPLKRDSRIGFPESILIPLDGYYMSYPLPLPSVTTVELQWLEH